MTLEERYAQQAFAQRTEAYPLAAQEYYLRTLWRGIHILSTPAKWSAWAFKLGACPPLPEVL